MGLSFERAFETEFPALHRYLHRRVGAAAADDLAAETFAVAFRRWSRFDQARPVRPWLYGIAGNLVSHHWRAERRKLRAYARTGVDPVLVPDGDAVDRLDAQALERTLAAGLADLRPQDREILLLHAWAELSDHEIAEALSLPLGTVKSRLHRARPPSEPTGGRRAIEGEKREQGVGRDTGGRAMTDHDVQVLAAFRSEVLLPDAETAEQIRRYAMRPPARAPRRLVPFDLRRPRPGVVVAAALVIVGGSVAAVSELPWWQNGAPPVDPQSVASIARDNLPAHVDTSRARTVVQIGDAALVAVPLNKTGYCLIPSLGGRANLGGQCDYQVVEPEQGVSDRTVSLTRPAPAAWIVYGRITDQRAAKIDLGAVSVPLETGGFFLAQVPEDLWPTLDGHANPGRILDAAGTTLRTGCVNWGPSPTGQETGREHVPLWNSSRGPCKPQPSPWPPKVDLDNAEKLVELTLKADVSIWKAGTVVALWQVPADDGRICTWVAAASPAPTGQADGLPGGPGECGGSADAPAASDRPFAGVSFSVGSGGLITGRVDRRVGVTKVVLESASATIVLPLGGGRFIGQLPEGGTKGQLPPGGRFTLIAYNADGKEIGRQSLEQIRKAATPPSG